MSQEFIIANPTQEVPEELEQQLQTALLQAAQDTNTPDIAVSVGVVTPEGTWTGATGISNLETQQATQPEDLFNIASISKSYTSAVILKLQEQGKLSLDDTIDKWLPDIAANLTNGESLTIHQLLNGTAGLWSYIDNEEFQTDFIADYLSGSNRDWQPEDLVAYAFGKPLFSGVRSSEIWTYTNTGNVIAALIAQEATGKPFKQILAEEILEPLGLNNTFFTTEDVSLEQRARGYEDIFTSDGNLGQDGIPEDYSILNTEIAYGPGSIVSSAGDVARFFDSLASGDLLSPESTAQIFNYVETGFERGSTEFRLAQFGLGVYPTKLPWGETRSMAGGIPGYESRVNYFQGSDTTISVLVNQNGSGRENLLIEAYKAEIANTLGLNDGSAINDIEADDYLTGTSNNDVMNGFEGNDIILGNKGLDALDGGVGDDFLSGGEGDDYLFGKEGNDNLHGDRDNDFLNGGVGDDLLTGGKGRDSLIGGDGQDTINGGKDNDILSGGAGDDLLRDIQGNNAFYGNDGDDLLFAGSGDDALYGDAGSDRLIANAGNDQLFGGSEDDYLNGGKGDDRLFGGKGNDTLIGLSGSNTLTGGNGSDLFMLSQEGTDTITDFTLGKDLLELPENISFTDLEIAQGSEDNADNTFITFNSKTLAILNNINPTTISPSELFFVKEIPEELEQKLETALLQAAQDTNTPDIAVSVGVVTAEVTWTGATGVSNLETQQATQTDDLFNIGSISKSYTSAVILKLQEQGKLSLDDTIDRWLPEIADQVTNGENLTIRQLLNGTGGLWDYVNGNDEFTSDLIADYLLGVDKDWQPEKLIAYAFGQPLFSGAGSTDIWTYTNTGNVIAALIAEEATGKPFDQILAEEILEPLGLNNTFFTTEDVSLEQRAKGYGDIFTADSNLGQDEILEDYSSVNSEWAYGAGSIVSSAENVARFFNSLASGDLLSQESTAEIFNYNNLGLNDGSAINGIEADDYLTGTSNNDVMNGFEGNDIILGNKGLDALDGGVGDDFLSGGEGDDYLFGKEGNDILYGDRDNDFLNGGMGNDLLTGGKGRDSLIGGDGQDTINGGKDNDILSGGAGNDLLRDIQGNNAFYGNDGDDLLFAGSGDDALYGDAGSDRLIANAGNDLLFGGSGDDYLNGGKGDDNLIGGEGNDTLIGLSGSNSLTGGEGSDRFMLSLDGTAIITDFTQGEDLLELLEKISFTELEIIQGLGDNAANTLISFESETLAILNDINSAEISQSDFENNVTPPIL